MQDVAVAEPLQKLLAGHAAHTVLAVALHAEVRT